MSAPENEFPAGAGVTALLGRTDDAAVGITQVQAFSTGFQFTLAVRLCRARPELVHRGLFELISSHVHPGKQIPLENRLLLGLEHADGRRASTVQNMRRLRPGGRPPPGSAPLSPAPGNYRRQHNVEAGAQRPHERRLPANAVDHTLLT
jgi:hypothetical protein